MLMIGTSSCSDNYNASLEPFETATTLTAQIDGKDLSKLEFSAEPKDTTIAVISNTRWVVDVSDGGWCTVNVVSGRGNGEIKLSVLEDMTADRNCEVVLYKLDANGERINDKRWIIAVSQKSSDVKLSPSSLEPFSAKPLKGQDFQITANVAWTLSIDYGKEVVKFITIQPLSGMTDEGNGIFSGNGPASFSISLQNNGTAAIRNAILELKSNAGSYSVEITQQKSEYTFDVSPNITQYVDPVGKEIDFTVLSLSGWNVSTNKDWISFSESGMSEGSEDRVGIKAIIAANTSGILRTGTIYFKPVNQGYVPVEIEVVQNGFDLTFRGDISEGNDSFTEAGGSLFYNLDSRFDWKVSAKDWIQATPFSGDRSENSQTIEMSIAVNNTHQSRSDSVMIIPLETVFEGGIHIDPKNVGVYPIKVFVDQAGGHEAAISRPWIGDVYEDKEVEVKYNFYSPSYEVKEAGLRWKKAYASNWENTTSIVPSNPNTATVSFLLEGLQAVTDYVAQGFLVLSNGETKDGIISYEFTTAGRFPDKGDNSPVENSNSHVN